MPTASYPADYAQQLETFSLAQLPWGEDYWNGIWKTSHWKNIRDSVQWAIDRWDLVTFKSETLRVLCEMQGRWWPLPKTLEDFHRLDRFGQTGFLLLHFLNSNLFTKTWLDISMDISDETDVPQWFCWAELPFFISTLSEHCNFLARVLESEKIQPVGYDVDSLQIEQKEHIDWILMCNWALKTIPRLTSRIKESIKQSDNTQIDWSNFTIDISSFNYAEQMLLLTILFPHNLTPKKSEAQIARHVQELKNQKYVFSQFQEWIDIWTELRPSGGLPSEIVAAISIGLLRGCTDDVRKKRPDLI